MIYTCLNCGGLYATGPNEPYAGKPCRCDRLTRLQQAPIRVQKVCEVLSGQPTPQPQSPQEDDKSLKDCYIKMVEIRHRERQRNTPDFGFVAFVQAVDEYTQSLRTQLSKVEQERDALKVEYESRVIWIKTINDIIGYNNDDGFHSFPCAHDKAKQLVVERDEARLATAAKDENIKNAIHAITNPDKYNDCLEAALDFLEQALSPTIGTDLYAKLKAGEEDTRRLDWLEKQSTLAIWQGEFGDSALNISLSRVGSPIVTLSTMESNGIESNEDNIGEGGSIRQAIDSAISS